MADWVAEGYADLQTRTLGFRDALLSSTLPGPVLDAVSANLAVLVSPTVLRQESGQLWAWEGCHPELGCCAGSCTHVWNYAQALPHLFPALERTLREQEYDLGLDDRGHVTFRALLPAAPAAHDFHAAADGQLGGILKLYRDWQISGDDAWMRRLLPLARRALDYAIRTWDPDRRGALDAPHHNTYDIEFWGPDPLCGTMYVGALWAMAQMLERSDTGDDAKPYRALAERAVAVLDGELWNGEHYVQRVLPGPAPEGLSDDEQALFEAEGPRYQVGDGCLSDGVIGAWLSVQAGVTPPFDAAHVSGHLRAVHAHNFRRDLSDHANTQRPGFAMGAEAGLLLCSWPRGGRPSLPFVYSDEVWTGIEYQVASHLIAAGLVDEGLELVAAVRERHDGRVRNPWDEYECGSHYARSMASYALLGALSGFRYSAVTRTLTLAPQLTRRPFRTFFSAATGFGTVTLEDSGLTVTLVEGELAVDHLEVRPTPDATPILRALTGTVVTPQAPLVVALEAR